jgi:hypothetical protein
MFINGFFLLWGCDPTRVMASSFLMFLDHTQRRTTVSRTPLDEWSVHCRDLYLTTDSIHNRQTSMPPVEFEPTILACQGPQTYATDRAVTGTYKWISPKIKLIRFDTLWRHRNASFGIMAKLRAGWPINRGSIPRRSTWFFTCKCPHRL